jgi:predicted NAD-dependent protein-ADP-ribosyltransferase YbiA (DUF1768 family)
VHEGIEYPSLEHYHLSMKIKSDQQVNGSFISFIDCRELISKMKNINDVRFLIRNFKIRKDWDNVKSEIIKWGIIEKFNNEDLKKMLIETGDTELLDEDNFGNYLMEIRESLKSDNNLPKGL